MELQDAVKFLSKVRLFEGLTRGDLEMLYDLGEEAGFEAGQVLIAEGQVGPPFQILDEGVAKVVLPKHRMKPSLERVSEVELNVMGRGECFGEYSLLDDMPASASVVATEPGKVLRISNDHFKDFLAADDRIGRIVYRNMLHILVGRLKRREGVLDLMLLPSTQSPG